MWRSPWKLQRKQLTRFTSSIIVLPLPTVAKDPHRMSNTFLILVQNWPVTDFEYAAMIKEYPPVYVDELAA